jgi:hypothetical protein
MVEHNNSYAKEMIYNQGANVTLSSAQQISRAAEATQAILGKFEHSINLKLECGRHSKASRSGVCNLIKLCQVRLDKSTAFPRIQLNRKFVSTSSVVY